MSFLRYKTHIEEGELVIAYLMPSHNGRGFMYLLHPTPELWTHVVPHRTQILYAADISYITTYLDLKPGSVVLESGTGSGSFSHSLARTIAPNGHLYTFEFHEERAKAVKQDFEEHGLSDLITIECRDVCKNGFGVTDLVHAVFLDLPAPWEAIPAAKEAFKQKRIGKISCFSPCIEQVQRTCASLNENGFVEIKMYECLMREHEIKTIPIYTVTDAVNKIKLQQDKKRKRKEDRDEQDNANADSQVSKSKQDPPNLYVSKTPNEVKGHTSYLTFATFLPVLEEQFLTK
ncbi:9977_t:CDS:2 [Funneliformis caledonium]|uniref:tRNA (adenine(58)-N(1))-methyltransferase catalytic subunit TRM61 n=1 Tax=Funneliformis caledonium TaxID=1117310 RepID=A0A9N9G3P0_9GLOM|nr:9977_t:CDS:2 [Funneliformis caledonium]